MRLKRLKVRNYGSFANLDLELVTEPGHITLITAPNGAGKSVLRQAFHDLLFDIPLRSPMRFRHGFPGMELHAEAVDGSGTPFSFGWVRNAKPQRVVSDPARYEALRNGVTPQQLESLFALDTNRLRKGGTDLKGGTTLSEALLAGTGELASARAARTAIDRRRDQNWGQGKSKPPLNAAASRLEVTRKRMRDAIKRPEARERDERDLAARARELEEARAARALATAETRRLNRIALTRPHLLALDEAETWLRVHADAPALPTGLEATLADARAEVVLAQARHEAADRTLKLAREAVDRIVRDPACTEAAYSLDRLPGMLGEAEKAAKDLVDRRAEHAAKMEGVRAGLKAVGSELPEHRAEEVIPTLGLKAEVQGAITEEAGLRKALDLAYDGVARTRAALTRADQEPSAVGPLPKGLSTLLAEIRADRNPVLHAEETASAAVSADAEVRRVLALVPGWAGTAEALRAVPLPAEVVFERLDAARSAAAARAEGARTHEIKLVEENGAVRAALDMLQRGSLPDTASVLAARAERDRGMRLILRRAFGAAPSEAEEAAYTRGEPVPLAYERQVRDADALADRRADQLKQVQEAERLEREIAARTEPLWQAASDKAQAADALAVAESEWTAAVAPLQLDSRSTITELRHACDARRALIEALTRSEVATAAEVALTRRHLAWADRLAGLMGVPTASLASLLALADQRAAAAQAAERAGVKRQATIESATRAVADALQTQLRAERAMCGWRDRWGRLLERLHRPDGESPAAVSAVLDGIAGLEKHYRDGLSLAGRIADMQADLGRFASLVTGLTKEVRQSEAATPAETARALIARFAAAAAAEAAWGQAGRALAEAVETERKAQGNLREEQAKLAAVVASCGAPDADGAEARIAASRAHADQVARRDAAREKLTEHGDGLPIAALRLEAEAVSVEEMALRRQSAEDAAASAQSRAETASAALNDLRRVLDQASNSTEALEAGADHEAAVATFDRALEEQLVLHLASTMLGDAMRAVEDGMGGSALARTSEAFSAVTDGAYGLESHDGPEGEELFAVEHAYPNERKALDDLSEGTRDQLYLALRLEALRNHCASAAALPFIADDVLQTFDDNRAKAALRALCDLSTDLQVIVLTHHPHLANIAKTLGGLVQPLELPR